MSLGFPRAVAAALLLAALAAVPAALALAAGDCVYDLAVAGTPIMVMTATVGYTEAYTDDNGATKKAQVRMTLRSPKTAEAGGAAVSGNTAVALAPGTTCSFTDASVGSGDPTYAILNTGLTGATVGADVGAHFRITADSTSGTYTKGNPDSEKGGFVDLSYSLDNLAFYVEMSPGGGKPLVVGSAKQYKVTATIVSGTFTVSGTYRKGAYDGSIDDTIQLAANGADAIAVAKTSGCSLKVGNKAPAEVVLSCRSFGITFAKATMTPAADVTVTLSLSLKVSGALTLSAAVSDATTATPAMLA